MADFKKRGIGRFIGFPVLVLAALLFSLSSMPGTAEKAETSADINKAPFELTMLDVGQGLSVLIEADGEYMLYDGGGRNSSSYVVAYLKQHNVTELKYIVASHHDEDHISGLVGVLNTISVKEALTADYEADTGIYESFMNMLASSGATELRPYAGEEFSLGSAKFQIISPSSYTHERENDNSIAIRVSYGKYSCIITGDAESQAEREMLSSGYTLKSDLYVVGHHGSSSSSDKAFVNAVSPDYVFLSVGADNSYGHPAEDTMATLKASGAELFRTDKQGEVIFHTDGETCWFSTDPCNDWSAGSTAVSGSSEAAASTSAATLGTVAAGTASGDTSSARTYILNTNSKKFHYPNCASVKKMSEKNKKEVTDTREHIIAMGYDPCGNCQP